MMTDSLASFHPGVRRWFESAFEAPTDVQAKAWPRIASGENLLITAPTGSGKTLTAFLWTLNQFITGALPTGHTRVLYISPLKALNNDIQRNLLSPLADLANQLAGQGIDFPNIRVETRSGDTEQADRRRMLRHPPEILITTPESLNLLLSSAGGQSLLTGIRTVILDEIHSVVDNKRGVYLMSAIERLVPLSGEFQRIALSATVHPMDRVAAWVGGFERLEGNAFNARPISVLEANGNKQYDIQVSYPEAAATRGEDDKIWDSLVPEFISKIRRNRSTLLFVNSRALCETITHKINVAAGETIAFAHHGSLSRELRFEVEQKLKQGELAAIVATSTLEMGIDIGALDEVLLIQSPDAVSSTVQRIGRAGHSVGETSRCTLYPTHPRDFIEAAVLARAVLHRDIESVRTIDCPLDVLAQVIISMTGTQTWDLDELFVELKRSAPYNNLDRTRFDLVINMLAGRYADNHIRELKPRVAIDRLENTIRGRPGALMSLYLSGGVIPDRGYFQLRLEDNNARIGELDEEFVWEAPVGRVFSFGSGHWQVKKITHNDVIVAPGQRTSVAPPFWKAEPISRDFHLSSRTGEFLEAADARLDDPGFSNWLKTDYKLDEVLATTLQELLVRQRAHTGTRLPHRHHLLAEKVRTSPGRASGQQLALHTGWGARVNRPLALALEAGWQDTFGGQPEIYVDNQMLVIQLADDIRIDELLALAPARSLEQRLRQRLEGSGFFGARFRENAGRALLLSKGRFNERKPLWMSRLQSQKLLEAVMKYEDFPILLETWRTCLQDEFDLESLRLVLEEIERGEIDISEVSSATPSPFAQSAAWGQINTYMYMNDNPRASRQSQLRTSLLEEVVFNPGIRPAIPRDVIDDFEARRQRRLPGYGPDTEEDLIEWVKERTAIPVDEWPQADWPLDSLPDKLKYISANDCGLVIAEEDAHSIEAIWSGKASGQGDEALTAHIANWMQYYGPRDLSEIAAKLGLPANRLIPILAALEDDRTTISGNLVMGRDSISFCDAANYESLLRFVRQASHRHFEPLSADHLPGFFLDWQTRFASRDRTGQLFETIERLRCLPLPAAAWETEILPARLPDYDPATLDALIQEGNLLWLGTPGTQVMFCFRDDLDLVGEPDLEADVDITSLLPDSHGRYDFAAISDRTGLPADQLAETLWQATWQRQVTNDTVAALRKGIESGFKVPQAQYLARTDRRQIRRGGFTRWRTSIPFAGSWFRIPWPAAERDLMQQEEINKDRVRVVLDRYGVIFRELLARELPDFGWRSLFRSIRLMELSGELVSGYFFDGIPGPQFASPEAFRLLQRSRQHDAIFWLNACDPASPCGSGLPGKRNDLPRRLPGNHLVYHGHQLVMVSERNGKALTFNVPPDAPDLADYLAVLRHLMYRHFQPVRKLDIETINGEPATSSPYLDALGTAFDLVRDYKSVYIQREI